MGDGDVFTHPGTSVWLSSTLPDPPQEGTATRTRLSIAARFVVSFPPIECP